MKAKFYLKDTTTNTGREYICENGGNVALRENAISFDSRREAMKYAGENFPNFDEWGYISSEY